jgi:MarR family transcriptional regulator, organic hydroperoxide resistance regulator
MDDPAGGDHVSEVAERAPQHRPDEDRWAEDRRVVTVALTRKGKDAVRNVPVVAQGLLLTGLEKLSDADLRLISEGMELLVGILGARRMPPQLIFSEEVNAPHDDRVHEAQDDRSVL